MVIETTLGTINKSGKYDYGLYGLVEHEVE